jgi:hypothetical protein
MNEKIKQLMLEAGYAAPELAARANKLAELIVRECTQLLFDESERLYGYSSECDNMRESEEAELVAEKCIDHIEMIEKHFGVE